MRRIGPTLLSSLACLISLTTSLAVSAARYDVALRGLGRPDVDAAAKERFRHFGTELALAMAVRPLQPAQTLGFSGFEFAMVSTFTTIHNRADYWVGQPNSAVLPNIAADKIPSQLFVPGIHLRKGLPWSGELGFSATYLPHSRISAIGGEIKMASGEALGRWMPAAAVRLAVSRLLGVRSFGNTLAQADLLASLPMPLAGFCRITPFVVGGLHAVRLKSGTIDDTPAAAADGATENSTASPWYSFKTIPFYKNLVPHVAGGLKMAFSMFELTYEFDMHWIPKDKLWEFASDNLPSHSLKFGWAI